MSAAPAPQHTLARPASLAGVALHTGAEVTLTLRPAAPDSGLKFRRADLPDAPTVDAKIENLKTVERATTIGEGSVKVQTVEHVLSALVGLGVDNAVVEMNSSEPPIGDGSAQPYVELIDRCGIVPQEGTRRAFFEVREPLHVESKAAGALLTLVPHVGDGLRVSCTQVGPDGRFTQYRSLEITPDAYRREIAPARTFTFYEDIQPLMDKGLIRGGSLENAIVVRGEAVMSKEPMRYADEFVRHKILDIVGDLALGGRPVRGHLIAIRPGHGPNAELTRALARQQAQLTAMAPVAPAPVTGMVLDIGEVMRLLPHRYPFLMVDRVVGFEGEDERKCSAVKQVTMNEPYFQGHFPGYPVMPGVLQLEAMAQVASIVILRQPGNIGKLGFFLSADNVKFRKPVVPGDTLFIHADLQKPRRNLVRATCHCTVNGAVVSEAELLLNMFDR